MPRQALAIAATRLRSTWDHALGSSPVVSILAAGVGLLAGAAHLARLGTEPARIVAGVGLALAALAAVAFPIVRRRWLADPRRDLQATAGRADPDQLARALRAADLVVRSRAEVDKKQVTPDSVVLAEVHLARSLWRLPLTRVAEVAAETGRRWSIAAVVVAAASAGAIGWAPFRIVEGLDVLAAQNGLAPLGLVYLEEVDGRATPPPYLKLPDRRVGAYGEAALPRGTTIAVRGRAVHDGRVLVLTDGVSEVPFVEDGSGDVVARWVLGDSSHLRVAARFGDVRVEQRDTLEVRSLPDAPPTVAVEGAPKQLRLLEVSSIPLVYEARDDHGLTEVALVLRAGTREERRTLSRPASDRAVERGGHELSARDPFFKKAHVPVEITIQARDDDAVSGPKWGKSAPIVVVPPRIGEPESLRLSALRDVRDAFVDLLAARADGPDRPKARLGILAAEERELYDAAQAKLEEALSEPHGGLSMRSRVRTIARGQIRRLDEATKQLAKAKSVASEHAWAAALEELILAIDASIEGLGSEDARSVAKRLADVADEAADAAGRGVDAAAREEATTRLDAAVEVLGGGGEMLLLLGDLGADLGEIVQNDLRRIARARVALAARHAELAARDLAARLRKPDPSFRGGGGHGHGGVESGGQAQPSDGPASEADRRSRQTERALEEILRDQAQEIQDVQDALDRALTQDEKDELEARAKKVASEVREAVKDLPREAAMPDSAQSKAAEARQEAEAMAGALERGRLQEATDRGQRAVEAMREASRRGATSPYAEDAESGRQAGGARPDVEQALQEVADALRAMREKGSERAKEDLEGSSQDQGKLSDRVGELSKKGEESDQAMPGEMLDQLRDAEDAMRDAARSLKQGRGEEGLEQQEKARRLLEMARGEREEPSGAEGDEPGRRDGDGRGLARDTPVPKERREGPEAFRKRVLEGLGKGADPRLREAVRRYAEGLLR